MTQTHISPWYEHSSGYCIRTNCFLGRESNTWVGNESAADSLDIGCSCNNTDEVQGKKLYYF